MPERKALTGRWQELLRTEQKRKTTTKNPTGTTCSPCSAACLNPLNWGQAIVNKDDIHKWGPKDTKNMTKPLGRFTRTKDLQQHIEFKRESVLAQKTMVYLEDVLQSKNWSLLHSSMGILVSILISLFIEMYRDLYRRQRKDRSWLQRGASRVSKQEERSWKVICINSSHCHIKEAIIPMCYFARILAICQYKLSCLFHSKIALYVVITLFF